MSALDEHNQIVAHANKCLNISVEEWVQEKAWQNGDGFREIVENVIKHCSRIGKLVLAAKLQALLYDKFPPRQEGLL